MTYERSSRPGGALLSPPRPQLHPFPSSARPPQQQPGSPLDSWNSWPTYRPAMAPPISPAAITFARRVAAKQVCQRAAPPLPHPAPLSPHTRDKSLGPRALAGPGCHSCPHRQKPKTCGPGPTCLGTPANDHSRSQDLTGLSRNEESPTRDKRGREKHSRPLRWVGLSRRASRQGSVPCS